MITQALQHSDNNAIWRSRDECGEHFPAGDLHDLMTVRESMTGVLRQRCKGAFRLRVIAEGPADLRAYQRGELATGGGRVREVLMGCGDRAWLFAQTLLPAATLAQCPWLTKLHDRPLGDVLFVRDDVDRGDFLFAHLAPDSPLCQRAAEVLKHEQPFSLWARRSYFFIAGQPLLVNEVFLPALARDQG